MGLEGQVAIVTGGGQGIGREIAFRLAEEGSTVVIADINEVGSWETAEEIKNKYRQKTEVVPTDIIYEEQIINLVNRVLELYSRIDILVNNSGIMGPIKNVEDITIQEWDKTVAVNLRGAFLCCKHVVPTMKLQNSGNIVNIASVVGKRSLPQRSPYASTKMGIIGLTRTLAAELGKWKIRVNCICPGEVKGPRLDRYLKALMEYSGKSWDEVVADRVELAPLKCFVDPKYIGAVVAFLVSENAAMITGQDFNVTAGAVMY